MKTEWWGIDDIPQQKLTPMMQQYIAIKKEHLDEILFFRMGDFYEMFFEDALLVSSLLDITLTRRDKNPIPMCGVPHHSSQSYIGKLIQMGYRVALCDQIEPVDATTKLVRREVTRTYSPGSVLEDDIVDAKETRYILFCLRSSHSWVGVFMEISQGECLVVSCQNQEQLKEKIETYQPQEVGMTEQEYRKNDDLVTYLQSQKLYTFTLEDYLAHHAVAQEELQKHFQTEHLEVFQFSGDVLMVRAIGAFLAYLRQERKFCLTHVTHVKVLDSQQHLRMDVTTFRHLEIFSDVMGQKTKANVFTWLNRTVTSGGERYLKHMMKHPYFNLDLIQQRQGFIHECLDALELSELIREKLQLTQNMRRIMARLMNGLISPRDCDALRQTLQLLPDIRDHIGAIGGSLQKWFEQKDHDMEAVVQTLKRVLADQLPARIQDGGVIREGCSDTLDEYRHLNQNGRDWIKNYQATEIERTGCAKLKIISNKVFGYMIELPRSFRGDLPENYVRKQTLANCERYVTEELNQMEHQILGASARALELEKTLFFEMCEWLKTFHTAICQWSDILDYCDVITSLALLAHQEQLVCPQFTSNVSELDIVEGWHPVVAQVLVGQAFVKNNSHLDQQCRCVILTGPNMAGKSTYIRQIALITYLAHLGVYVPAKSVTLGLVDQILTRIGSSDNLSRGQSTFMMEMIETSRILHHATNQSLIILDEVGRGTSTKDGLSLARAIVEYIAEQLHSKMYFATHYHELIDCAERYDTIVNAHVDCQERDNKMVFLHHIVEGGTEESYGIHVAQLAGIPDQVIGRALRHLEEYNTTQKNQQSAEKPLNLFDSYIHNHEEVIAFSQRMMMELVPLNVHEMTEKELREIILRMQEVCAGKST